MRSIVSHAVLISFLPFALSCTTRIEPPARLEKGEVIALLDHGHHSTLVLPTSQHGAVRFAYGDWQYYALNKSGVFRGFAALLWPSQAALGRRVLPGPLTRENLLRRIPEGVEGVLLFRVEARLIEEMIKELDGIYEANRESRVLNLVFDLEFVHYPGAYSIFRNSNRVIGEWLMKLGCKLRGGAWFSKWEMISGRKAEISEK